MPDGTNNIYVDATFTATSDGTEDVTTELTLADADVIGAYNMPVVYTTSASTSAAQNLNVAYTTSSSISGTVEQDVEYYVNTLASGIYTSLIDYSIGATISGSLNEIIDCCLNIGLFKEKDSFIISPRMAEHKEYRNFLSIQGRMGAEKRWEKNSPPNAYKGKERKGKENKYIFTPPNLKQVKEYCDERKNGVDAERFINFYEAKGWMVGKNKMKNWQAAVRTWEKSSTNNQSEDVIVPDYAKSYAGKL